MAPSSFTPGVWWIKRTTTLPIRPPTPQTTSPNPDPTETLGLVCSRSDMLWEFPADEREFLQITMVVRG